MISKILSSLLIVSLYLQPLAVNAENQTFFVIGDTGDCDQEGAALVGKALRGQAEVTKSTLIETGDLAYPVATRERLLTCHEPHFNFFARRFAVPGNHDWADAGGTGFYSVFPEPMPRKENLTGNWQLLMLNSNLREEAWQNQLAWLDKTLAKSQGECLIAAWHHPRWSSAKHGDNRFTQGLWERLQGQATFTLHGHDHHFEALPELDENGLPKMQGVASFVVGNSGAKLYAAGTGPTRSNRAHYGQWGFMRLELAGQNYRWQAFNTDGKIIDRGEGQCQPAGKPHAPR